MVTAPEYRHAPTGTLAVLAQRLGKVWASPSTWYRLVRKFGWRRRNGTRAPTVVVSVEVTDLKALELQQEVLKLRRRVKKLTALLRLTLALLRSSGFTLAHERLPDERVKIQILRAVDRAREFVSRCPWIRQRSRT